MFLNLAGAVCCARALLYTFSHQVERLRSEVSGRKEDCDFTTSIPLSSCSLTLTNRAWVDSRISRVCVKSYIHLAFDGVSSLLRFEADSES